MARTDSLLVVRISDGAVINRIGWDGESVYDVADGLCTRPDNGESLDVPISVAPPTVTSDNMLSRLNPAEQDAIISVLVSAGLISESRASQIVDLSKSSS